ncbi:MAG: polymer-forming cytoskeletal protein [Chitinophagaceae bacterium]|nr:polymer-forming cytoskeletal protein [Chitinophagaceae bacterium]
MSIFSSNKDRQEPTPAPVPLPKAPQNVQTQPTQTPISSSNMTNIANGTIVDGQIKIEGDIKIEGIVKGTITSKGKVQITTSGKVEGDIICQNADISGHVTGKLKIADILMLKGSAIIDGDINTGKIVIESGVKFNGNCTMGAAANAAQQPAAKAEMPKPATANTASANAHA